MPGSGDGSDSEPRMEYAGRLLLSTRFTPSAWLYANVGGRESSGAHTTALVGLWTARIPCFIGQPRFLSGRVLTPAVLQFLWASCGSSLSHWKPCVIQPRIECHKAALEFRGREELLRGPIHVFRVLLGAAVAVAGGVS